MKLSAYKESNEKQLKGVPVFVGDSIFYIKRWGTKESQEFVKQLRKELYGPFHKDMLIDENVIIGEWLAEYSCVGWEGLLEESATEDDEATWHFYFKKFKDFFGKKKLDKPLVSELKYSKANARNIFTNPDYYLSLNSVLFNAAMNFENFLYDDAETDINAIKKN